MICRNCGKEFEGQFCPHCGHDSSKPTKAEKASKRKESVDKVKEKLKPASDFVKKHKLLVIIVAAVLAVAIIVGTTLGVVLSNDFRVGKMNQIKIGMTKAEVEKKLGKPHEDEASTWIYYSKNYKKLIDEANELLNKLETLENEKELEKIIARMEELEKESETAVRDEIRIRFSDDKVYAVEMLKEFSEETKNAKKEVKKARLSQKEIKRFTTLPSPVYAIVEYKDGSYRNAPVVLKEQLNTETVGKQSVTWHDEWSDTEVTAEIKVVKNPDIYRQGTLDNGGTEYFIFEENGKYALTILGNGTIPEKDAYPWDDLKEALVRVSVGNGVTSIGEGAFEGCSSLKSVEIPDSVTSIDFSAFRGCNAIESLTCPTIAISYIPKSKLKTIVLTSGDSIGENAFSGCSSLTSVEIPNSVTSIGSDAFEDTGIWNNAADNSVVYAGKWAVGYKGERSTVTNIALRADTVGIGNNAFEGCSSLVSIVIPDSVTSIGSYVFEGTGIWDNTANNSIVYADKWAIGYKGKITNVILRADTVGIGSYAFRNCSNLESIEIPDSVTSIGGSAFSNCRSLESVVIPDSVTYIGGFAFYYCDSLESVVIPDSVTYIGGFAFSYCDSLESVVIPDSVTYIGGSAFSYCDSLESVEIPNSITSIGYRAFEYCSSLVSIVIPNSVTSIGSYAFSSCSSLTIYVEASAKPSGWDSDWNRRNCPVVGDCKNNDLADDGFIYTVQNGIRYGIKDGVATVARQPSNIKTANIPSEIVYKDNTYRVTSIGSYAFSECSSLESIEYGGTKAEWKAIKKGNRWNEYTSNYTVKCTDGTLTKAQS